ncbi:MAG: flagellar biosynthesis protein FlgF, partial [Chloroflexota bacterium]
MIRGLYSAASALVAGLFRQELIAQDLANINTPGYKAASTRLSDFATMLLARLPGGIGPATPLGRLTHGVQTSAAITDFSPGPVQATGQPLDLAIQGEGFFRLRTPDGERFTRDGRFSLDANGQLVNVNGHPVLGTNGQPIRLSSGQVRVDPNGTIYLNDQPAGQIGLAVFADPTASLQRSENGLFAAVGAAPTG